MDANDIRYQVLKISTLLREMDELLVPDKIHLAPMQTYRIKDEAENLNRMIWRVEPWKLTD